MKEIYILLTKTNTVLSKAIARVTGDPYTHSAISLDRDFSELYSFSRKAKDNLIKAGFVKEQFVGSIYEENLDCDCAVYMTQISDEQYAKLAKELRIMRERQDIYKYNFLGLFNCILGTKFKRKNKYFCSEFVAEMLDAISILPTEYIPQTTKPSDFCKMNIFHNIFKGKLREATQS